MDFVLVFILGSVKHIGELKCWSVWVRLVNRKTNLVLLCFMLKMYPDLFFILLHSFSLLLSNDNMTSVSGLVYG